MEKAQISELSWQGVRCPGTFLKVGLPPKSKQSSRVCYFNSPWVLMTFSMPSLTPTELFLTTLRFSPPE